MHTRTYVYIPYSVFSKRKAADVITGSACFSTKSSLPN